MNINYWLFSKKKNAISRAWGL